MEKRFVIPWRYIGETTDKDLDEQSFRRYYKTLERATLSPVPSSIWKTLMPSLKALQHKSILEAGCGQGGLTRKLISDLGPAGDQFRFTDIDLNHTPLTHANREINGQTHFAQANGLKLPFKDKEFGLAISYFVLHHLKLGENSLPTQENNLEAIKQFIQEISRVSEKFFIVDTNRAFLPGFFLAPLLALILSKNPAVAHDTAASYFRGFTEQSLAPIKSAFPETNIFTKGFHVVVTNYPIGQLGFK